jgi:hypothetical protein
VTHSPGAALYRLLSTYLYAKLRVTLSSWSPAVPPPSALQHMNKKAGERRTDAPDVSPLRKYPAAGGLRLLRLIWLLRSALRSMLAGSPMCRIPLPCHRKRGCDISYSPCFFAVCLQSRYTLFFHITFHHILLTLTSTW